MANKTYYAVAGTIVAVLGSVAYFTGMLPTSSPPLAPPTLPQETKIDLPISAILIPAGEGICRMHALDNATGQIMDYGVVKCSNASAQNLDAWNRATNKDKFVEIGKSFRHEGEP
jgi:hypothetical protein